MAELSPAAQVVFDAYRLASDGHYRDGEWIQDNAGQVAAALRAAADQVVPKTPPPKFAPHYEEGIWDGKNDAREQLLAIAAELKSCNE